MKRRSWCLAIALLASLNLSAANYGDYKGKGGMSAYKILPEVYEYHYDKGFIGPDAMGWDPNMQYAWSRLAAAHVCGIAADKKAILDFLQANYHQSPAMQEIVGVDFHEAQVKANPTFCTTERMDELKRVIPPMEQGQLEEPFGK